MFVTKLIRLAAVIVPIFWLNVAAVAQPPSSSPYIKTQGSQSVDPALMPVGEVTFFSHSFGENFPHAFVIVEQVTQSGQPIYDAFGFSAKHLSPKILFGRVDGHIAVPGPRYVRQSDPHFRLLITAEQKYRLDMIRDRWSQTRYSLNKQNCVHFIAELAHALGLQVNWNSEHFKEPKSFLEEVLALNPGLQGSLRSAPSEVAR